MSPRAAGEGVEHWEAVGRAWQRERPQQLWRAHSDAINLELLARWLPAGQAGCLLKTDLFDEAFGQGLYPLLGGRAQRVVGIDLSGSVAGEAQGRQLGLSAACADVRRLPFAGGAFDVVVSNSTLDHFGAQDDILQSLRELARVLRPGGQLIVTLDNLANPAVAVRNRLPFGLLRALGLVPYYVGASCGPHRLQELLEQAGFEVCEMGAIVHCPRVLAVPLAALVQKHAGPRGQAAFLRGLLAFERLGQGPWRFVTGHFLAARALKAAPA